MYKRINEELTARLAAEYGRDRIYWDNCHKRLYQALVSGDLGCIDHTDMFLKMANAFICSSYYQFTKDAAFGGFVFVRVFEGGFESNIRTDFGGLRMTFHLSALLSKNGSIRWNTVSVDPENFKAEKFGSKTIYHPLKKPVR